MKKARLTQLCRGSCSCCRDDRSIFRVKLAKLDSTPPMCPTLDALLACHPTHHLDARLCGPI